MNAEPKQRVKKSLFANAGKKTQTFWNVLLFLQVAKCTCDNCAWFYIKWSMFNQFEVSLNRATRTTRTTSKTSNSFKFSWFLKSWDSICGHITWSYSEPTKLFIVSINNSVENAEFLSCIVIKNRRAINKDFERKINKKHFIWPNIFFLYKKYKETSTVLTQKRYWFKNVSVTESQKDHRRNNTHKRKKSVQSNLIRTLYLLLL